MLILHPYDQHLKDSGLHCYSLTTSLGPASVEASSPIVALHDIEASGLTVFTIQEDEPTYIEA
jgi:hypothetical protein